MIKSFKHKGLEDFFIPEVKKEYYQIMQTGLKEFWID